MTECRACHTEKAEGEAKFPTARVYRIPDFVFFDHSVHVKKGKVGCGVCHGDTGTAALIKAERTLNMKFCVDCHKAKEATTACNVCHELGQ